MSKSRLQNNLLPPENGRLDVHTAPLAIITPEARRPLIHIYTSIFHGSLIRRAGKSIARAEPLDSCPLNETALGSDVYKYHGL